MQVKFLFIILTLILTLYCGSSDKKGFSRGESQERTENTKAYVDDADIKTILDRKPQIRFPIRLGIYLDSGSYWRFTQKDKDKIYDTFKVLKEKGIASDIFYVSDALVTGDVYRNNYSDYYPIREYYTKLKTIRTASARYTADVVFVIRNYNDTEQSSNFFSVLYLTIIGMWVSPGTKIESSFYLSGSLWDVRNEYLYFTSEYEGNNSIIRPLILSERKDAIKKAKEETLLPFLEDSKSKFLEMKKSTNQ